jgi:hypothetical protein
MNPDEERQVEDAFASGIRLIMLVFIAAALLAGGLAFLLDRFGPVLGSTLSVVSTLGILATVAYIFARTVRRLRVRRKRAQRALVCAYCKDSLIENSASVCPECGSMYHDECLRTNGCATFACLRSRPRQMNDKTSSGVESY